MLCKVSPIKCDFPYILRAETRRQKQADAGSSSLLDAVSSLIARQESKTAAMAKDIRKIKIFLARKTNVTRIEALIRNIRRQISDVRDVQIQY